MPNNTRPVHMKNGENYSGYSFMNTNAVAWSEMNELGAKNLIPYPYVIGSVVYDSVTYTDLGDGRIQLNGTNSSTSDGTSVYFTDFFTLKAGTYILSTVTATGVNYNLYLNDGSATIADTLRDENVIFTITNDVNVKMGIWITAGNINSNVIVYPMLRYASIEDSTWVPYAMTNRELTELAQIKVLATANANQTWASQLASLSTVFYALNQTQRLRTHLLYDNVYLINATNTGIFGFTGEAIDPSGNLIEFTFRRVNNAYIARQLNFKTDGTFISTDISSDTNTSTLKLIMM